MQELQDFSRQGLEDAIKEYLEQAEVKFKLLAQPLRVVLTAKTASPGLFETMEVLGKDRVLRRIAYVLVLAEG